ncbi:melanotransferrin [Copidosoma floridanum]|uniref:melanotransferrin n=1 Tax=Copidosoma floridanum TaxID=29053 RepID=UPI0006C995B6|nr:melanotransferrin [Copidosoma floridanum]
MWTRNPSQRLVLLSTLLFVVFGSCAGQNLNNTATWCTTSDSEQNKCLEFARAVDSEIASFRNFYISIKCKQAFNKDECMSMLDQEKAQLTTLDAGEVFVGGRYHSLVPIMQEIYESGVNYQYAVAVVKKGKLPDVHHMRDLRGKKACFAGVGMLAGWVTPIYNLMKDGGMEIVDCNNHVKSTIKFFGPSCAVNSLVNIYNPLGDNSDQLCELCIGKIPGGKCTKADPYAGYEGAFKCLVDVGDVAFLVHTTVDEMTSTNFELHSIKKEKYELLCRNGSRRDINEYAHCNWGEIPSNAIVVSSATNQEKRKLYQRFLEEAVRIFGKHADRSGQSDSEFHNNRSENREDRDFNDDQNRDHYNSYNRRENYNNFSTSGFDDRDRSTQEPNIQTIEKFHLFESAPRYGRQHNLLFSDVAKDFVRIQDSDQNFSGYLKKSLEMIYAVRRCPVNRMTLCVTSEPEFEKCTKMKIALKAQLMQPELLCFKGQSHIHCMQAIQNGQADVTVLDAGDVYTAGQRYELIPFISEVYNLGSPVYYAVAVAKVEDNSTDLTYLKTKNTCSPGINTAAGWVHPMAYLLSNSWIRGYGCDSVRAASEYFSKSCVPGARNTEYNTRVPDDNMCDLCHGTKDRYCRRDASEDYYGHTGAIRCLVEGGGDVAFVKHTTVAENTDGKRREFWARNTFTTDLQLLCPDGTRKSTLEYHDCNLGKIAANAVVTRGGYYGYNETQINAYLNLLIYAQQFYGRKNKDDFTFAMFYSQPPYSDLIFQDATQQLAVIPPEKRNYIAYLGEDFLRARRIVDCTAGSAVDVPSIVGTLVMMMMTLVFGR